MSAGRSGGLICYDSIGLHLLCRHFGLLHFISFSSLPTIEAHVRYDLLVYLYYDTILLLSCVRYYLAFDLLYDINLGATATTILSTRGVTISIDLVSSATDSSRQCVVLFKTVLV